MSNDQIGTLNHQNHVEQDKISFLTRCQASAFGPLLFSLTIFTSASLMFLVQPMQGKMLLPLLGGTPGVWNTCMVFFQAVLLLGYLYAHFLTKYFTPRRQLAIHSLVLFLPLLLLPISIPQFSLNSNLMTSHPSWWLLMTLVLSSGVAFFAVSSTAPLLQRWFSLSSHRHAHDPYFLYATSNLGSMLALIGYPFLVEPYLGLKQQASYWAFGYAVMGALILSSAALVLMSNLKKEGAETDAVPSGDLLHTGSGPTNRDRLFWLLLAFVPSSIMLGTTTFMTTDVAAIPLLWVVPLALYLLTFIIVFSNLANQFIRIASYLAPLVLVTVMFLIFSDLKDYLWLSIGIHLSGLFLACIVCHGQLALRRPPPKYLTEFFFLMSLGGVLGGIFNALIAPHVFKQITEYPLMIVAACMLYQPWLGFKNTRQDLYWAVGIFFALLSFTYACMSIAWSSSVDYLSLYEVLNIESFVMADLISFALPALVACFFIAKPLRFGSALLGLTVMATVFDPHANIILRERSFFGVLSVKEYQNPLMHSMIHGSILHGEQRFGSKEERLQPTSYYHREGPVGQLVDAVTNYFPDPEIAVIGLGTGTMAAYGSEELAIKFYEIDPMVERVARDPKYFTYISDCLERGCKVSVVLGDARLKIAESESQYELILVDAFSSDAIPIHLITKEALQTYLSKLVAGGIVAFHISNRYIDLEPVLENIGKDMGLGYAIKTVEGYGIEGMSGSTWVIFAEFQGPFNDIIDEDDQWHGLIAKDGVGLWTDDYVNMTKVINW